MSELHRSTALGHPPASQTQKSFDLRRGSFHPALLQGHETGGRPSRDYRHDARRRNTLTHFRNSLSIRMNMRRGTKFSNDSLKSQTSVKTQNSYQLEPAEGEIFQEPKVEKLMHDILNIQLAGVRYDPSTARELSCKLSALIQNKVKEMPIPRYKIVSHVILGQTVEQGLHIASRGLWDSSCDNWACATFQNESICAVASVYAVYFE